LGEGGPVNGIQRLVRKLEAREWQRSLSSAFWQRN
jgi:hypothetical protein